MDAFIRVVARLVASAAADPSATAVADVHHRWDRAHLVGAAGGVAALLRARDVGSVAVLADDGRDAAVAILGALAAGATLLQLDRSDAHGTAAALRAAGAELLLRGGDPPPDRAGVPEVALRDVAPAPLTADPVDPDAVALRIRSSGSTGAARLLTLTRADLLLPLTRPAGRPVRRGDRLGLLLGTSSMLVRHLLPALEDEVPVHVLDARDEDPGTLLAVFTAADVTVLLLVPTYLRRIATAVGDGVALPSLRHVTTLGEPLRWEDVALVRARLSPTCTVENAYGATDVGRVASRDIPPDEPLGNGTVPVGWPRPGVTIGIVAADGSAVAPGTIGEIVVDSPFPRENPTRVPLSDGRYRYRTGDLGRLLDDGQLELHGRADRIVKVGGARVSPDHLEALLRRLPGIAEAHVDIDPAAGSPTLTAHVAVDVRSGPDMSEVWRRLRADLRAEELPHAIVVHRAPFPTLRTGKVDGPELRRRAAGGPQVGSSPPD